MFGKRCHEEFRRFDRARSVGGRDFLGGGGQPHLYDLRRGSRGALSGIGQDIRGDGGGGKRPPPHAAGNVRTALRQPPSADSQGKRQGIPAPPPDLVDQEPLARHHPQGSRDHGVRSRAVLCQGRRAGPGCRRPPAARRSRGSGKRPRENRSQADGPDPEPRRARGRGKNPAAGFRAGICATGPGRIDGRLGVDAGALVRRRLCHPPQLADVPGRARRLDRRRHQHGLCRSLIRRRLPDRARFALVARRGQWRDDGTRRSRPHHALSGARLLAQCVLDRDGDRGRRGVLRIVGHRLYSRTLYGHAVPSSRVPDRARRRHRAHGGHSHRRGIAGTALMNGFFRRSSRQRLCLLAGAAVSVVLGQPAHATDEIQVYNAGIAAPGQFTIQQHLNYVALGIKDPPFPGGLVSHNSINGTPEFAYGVTDWWEVGLYLPFAIQDQRFMSDSFKLRTLFVSPNAEQRNFFYGVNFEFSNTTPKFSQSRFGLEIRPIIGVRTADYEFIINPIVDISFGQFGEADFAPAARLARKVMRDFYLGLEYYGDLGKIGDFAKLSDQQHTLFAVT